LVTGLRLFARMAEAAVTRSPSLEAPSWVHFLDLTLPASASSRAGHSHYLIVSRTRETGSRVVARPAHRAAFFAFFTFFAHFAFAITASCKPSRAIMVWFSRHIHNIRDIMPHVARDRLSKRGSCPAALPRAACILYEINKLETSRKTLSASSQLAWSTSFGP